MDIILVVLLVLAGVALLLMELFLLPGFGIAGVGGFGFLVGAVMYAYYFLGLVAGMITLGVCVLVSVLAIWGFMRSKALDKMDLDTKIDSQVTLADNRLKEKQEAEEQSKI